MVKTRENIFELKQKQVGLDGGRFYVNRYHCSKI